MDKLVQIAHFLVSFAASIYIMIIMVRFLLQLVRADFYNPLSQFIVKVTNPLLMPLRKIIPGFFGIDLASIILAIVLQFLTVQVLAIITGHGPVDIAAALMFSVYELIHLALNIYMFSLIILVIVSWVAPQSHNPALSLLSSITEPVLRPIRRSIPPMGGLDFSVMIALVFIYILKIIFS